MVTASDESYIILQDTLLTGVTNLSFSNSVNQRDVILLSNRGINRKVNAPSVATCSFEKKYLGKDFISELTGYVGLSGQFVYGTGALDFTDAAISNYRISMNPNEAPTVNVELKIYGDLKPASSIRSSVTDEDIYGLDARSLRFNYMNKVSPVSAFSYSAAFDCKPTYEIESSKSSAVRIFTPVKINASATLELSEDEFVDITGISKKEAEKTISFSFIDQKAIDFVTGLEASYLEYTGSGLETGVDAIDFATGFAKLNTYETSDLRLQNQNLSITVQDTIKMQEDYAGFSFNLPTGLPPVRPSGGGILSVLSGLQDAVDDSLSGFFDFFNLTKSTGENFEDFATGSGQVGDFMFNMASIITFQDFESFDTGVTTGDLYSFVPEETEILFVFDFEDSPTGQTSENFTEMPRIY